MSIKYSAGIWSILFCVLLVLKLMGQIAISWFWVCAPLWMPAAFAIVILLVILLISFFIGFFLK